MSITYKSVMEGEKDLLATFTDMPNRVQMRVHRFAGRKVAKAISVRAAANTPRRSPPGKDGLGHLADRMISVQKVFRPSGTTVNIVGGEAGKMNQPGRHLINHLVEEGTAQRFTGHKTKYRQSVDVRIGNKRIKTANGYKTVKIQEQRMVKKSVGSFRVGSNPVRNRGRMPAFHQLRKAVEQTPVEQIYESELRAGIQRIADRQVG